MENYQYKTAEYDNRWNVICFDIFFSQISFYIIPDDITQQVVIISELCKVTELHRNLLII
jgi:hypothetical protein